MDAHHGAVEIIRSALSDAPIFRRTYASFRHLNSINAIKFRIIFLLRRLSGAARCGGCLPAAGRQTGSGYFARACLRQAGGLNTPARLRLFRALRSIRLRCCAISPGGSIRAAGALCFRCAANMRALWRGCAAFDRPSSATKSHSVHRFMYRI